MINETGPIFIHEKIYAFKSVLACTIAYISYDSHLKPYSLCPKRKRWGSWCLEAGLYQWWHWVFGMPPFASLTFFYIQALERKKLRSLFQFYFIVYTRIVLLIIFVSIISQHSFFLWDTLTDYLPPWLKWLFCLVQWSLPILIQQQFLNTAVKYICTEITIFPLHVQLALNFIPDSTENCSTLTLCKALD